MHAALLTLSLGRLSLDWIMLLALSFFIFPLSALDKLYEPKENKKLFKVVTVVAYVFSVSMVAILLSLYYLFLWNPYIKQHQKAMEKMGVSDQV